MPAAGGDHGWGRSAGGGGRRANARTALTREQIETPSDDREELRRQLLDMVWIDAITASIASKGGAAAEGANQVDT